MGFYDHHIMPRVVDFACSLKPISYQRRLVVPQAQGVVLEIGIGSGLNLAFYDPSKVKKIIGVDPDDQMWARSERRRSLSPIPIERIGLSGEEIPLEKNTADTVLVTYTLCTIPNAVGALKEMRRVLKPGGTLVFSEHGEAPEAHIRKWQDRIEPYWKKIAGGCHPGRPIPNLLSEGGWSVTRMDQGYIPGPKPLTYNYWGTAEKA